MNKMVWFLIFIYSAKFLLGTIPYKKDKKKQNVRAYKRNFCVLLILIARGIH